jgi:hypothetical protein
MHVISHQHIGMNGAAAALRRFPQELEVLQVVKISKEYGSAVMATLNGMHRQTGHKETGLSRHGRLVRCSG